MAQTPDAPVLLSPACVACAHRHFARLLHNTRLHGSGLRSEHLLRHMSSQVQPWICSYLINIAETYGGDWLSLPHEAKNKKVQVIKVRVNCASPATRKVCAVLTRRYAAGRLPVPHHARARVGSMDVGGRL